MTRSIVAIAVFHQEGRLAEPTLRSFSVAITQARATGMTVEPTCILDRPDDATAAVVAQYAPGYTKTLTVDYGDQGLARNHAVAAASTDYVALLDGDDLWTPDWLSRGVEFLEGLESPETSIAHPEFNWLFGLVEALVRQPDQTDPDFDADAIHFANPWDALAIAAREIYLQTPFQPRDKHAGWGYEDWAWNWETMQKGIQHRVVPETVIFKRRRQLSASADDIAGLVLPRSPTGSHPT